MNAKVGKAGSSRSVPWIGARKFARELLVEIDSLKSERDASRSQLERLGALSVLQPEAEHQKLQGEVSRIAQFLSGERAAAEEALARTKEELAQTRQKIVETEDSALLQESGIYNYYHPLTDAVAYQAELGRIQDQIKEMNRKEGGAVLASTSWTVNGSASQGRAMVRDFSKLMLRAFNAEADNLVRGLKPYKAAAAIERLIKVSETIERLGKTMSIRISREYADVRIREIKLTADFLNKLAVEKEAERQAREKMKEERKVQQEMERERAKLNKERQHYQNALDALLAKGDAEGVARIRAHLEEVDRAIQDVDYRAANIRAGYVYVISNIGSFGEALIKVGMTRRLDPMDRIRELSDASVPFNFDVHALFFSKDAVGIEGKMHTRLAAFRVNLINQRREFFRVTAADAKHHLGELAGELLTFQDIPDALEYRQSLARRSEGTVLGA